MAAYGQFAFVEAITLLPDFFQISCMNYFYLALARSESKFGPINDNKMAAKMTASCQFAFVYILIKLFITQFLPNYIYGLFLLNSFPRPTVHIVG